MIMRCFLFTLFVVGFTSLCAQTTIEYDVSIDTIKSEGKSELVFNNFHLRNKNIDIQFPDEIKKIGNFEARVYYHFDDCLVSLDTIKYKDGNLSQKQKNLIFEFIKNWLMTVNFVFYYKEKKIECRDWRKSIHSHKWIIRIAQTM